MPNKYLNMGVPPVTYPPFRPYHGLQMNKNLGKVDDNRKGKERKILGAFVSSSLRGSLLERVVLRHPLGVSVSSSLRGSLVKHVVLCPPLRPYKIRTRILPFYHPPPPKKYGGNTEPKLGYSEKKIGRKLIKD